MLNISYLCKKIYIIIKIKGANVSKPPPSLHFPNQRSDCYDSERQQKRKKAKIKFTNLELSYRELVLF